MTGHVLKPWLVDEGHKTAAHELPELFVRNCAVYVFKTKLLKQHITYGKVSLGFVMPSNTSVDINDNLEFNFAEYVYRKEQT